jgi:hypothetical protein
MKFPKGWNKMNLKEQENYLVTKLHTNQEENEQIRKLLAKVRGGNKVELLAEERADLQYDVPDKHV